MGILLCLEVGFSAQAKEVTQRASIFITVSDETQQSGKMQVLMK